MKKILSGKILITSAIAIAIALVTMVAPALAAWAGGFTGTTQIKEPLALRLSAESPVSASTYPGQMFILTGENINGAPVVYGMVYTVNVYYEWNEMGGGIGSVSLGGSRSQTTVVKSENATLKPAVGGATPMAGGMYYSNIADVTMTVDPDGTGPLTPVRYMTGQKINIAPNGTHALIVNVRVKESAYPGNIRVYLDSQREEPNP